MTFGTIGKVAAGIGIALGAAGTVLVGSRSEAARASPPSAAEVQDLRVDVKELVKKLEAFDRRLSYMEGAAGKRAPADP